MADEEELHFRRPEFRIPYTAVVPSPTSAVRERLRLALVFPHPGLGGGERAMIEVAAGLGREFEIDLCVLDAGGVGERADDGPPALVAELRERLGGGITLITRRWQLRQRLAAADVVLGYGVSNAVPRALGALAAGGRRPASVRVVHTEREVDGSRFQRRWGRVIDTTVCVVPRVAREIPGGVFVPNPIPGTGRDGNRLAGSRRDLFADDGGESHRPTLGFLGRLVPLKNVSWLIENLATLGCNLAVQAYDSELETAADLARLAAARGVAKRVSWLPPGGEVGTLLRSIDALVVASSHEGFPMVVVEAGAVGTPVVATRVGALPELFAEEIDFVDFADPAAGEMRVPEVGSLRRAIAAAAADPARGARLREKVLRLCDPRAVAARYAEILRDAAARHAGRTAAPAAHLAS